MNTQPTPTDAETTRIPPNPTSKPVFPNEIFGLVIASLPRSQLPTVAQVCKLFRDFETPQLYHSVIIDVNEEMDVVAHDLTPGLHCRLSLFSSHTKAFLSAEKRDAALMTAKPKGVSFNRFDHTKILTLASHTYQKSQHLASIHMPNLQTLRILNSMVSFEVRTDKTHLDFCSCCHFGEYDNDERCAELLPCSCPLLDNLIPYRLIIGTCSAGLYGSGLGLWPTSPIPPATITEIVVLIGDRSTSMVQSSSEPALSLLMSVPDTVRRLTLVMTTWSGGLGQAWDGEFWLPLDRDDDGSLLDTLAEAVAMACWGEAQLVEIVGYETFPRERWTEDELAEQLERVRMELASLYLKTGRYEKKEAITRADAVQFLTGKEYLERDGDMEMKKSRAAVVEAIKDYRGIMD